MTSQYKIKIRENYTYEDTQEWLTKKSLGKMDVLLGITRLNQQPIGITITPSVGSGVTGKRRILKEIEKFIDRHTFSSEEDIIKVVNAIIEGKRIREPEFVWRGTCDWIL